VFQSYTLKKINRPSDTTPQKTQNIAIIGLTPIGSYIMEHYGNHSDSIKIKGFICLSSKESQIKNSCQMQVLGNGDELKKIVKAYSINKILIALDIRDVSLVQEAIRHCLKHNIDYEIISNFYDDSCGFEFNNFFKGVISSLDLSFRRCFDLFTAIFLLLIFTPIWFIITVLIKISNPGILLCSQEYIGQNGRTIRLYHFRIHKIRNQLSDTWFSKVVQSPELILIGKYLKNTGLMYLPLLLNVIQGDLSIIGPQPIRPYFVEKYKKIIPFFEDRLKIKPGLVGLGEVETAYDDLIEDVREKLKYDLFYLDHQKSLLLNLKIIFKSFWVFLLTRGR